MRVRRAANAVKHRASSRTDPSHKASKAEALSYYQFRPYRMTVAVGIPRYICRYVEHRGQKPEKAKGILVHAASLKESSDGERGRTAIIE